MTILKPILIEIDNCNIYFKTEYDEMIYKTNVNDFVENSGMTIQNVSFPLILEEKGYYINLSDISTTFGCGHILKNLIFELEKNDVKNSLLIFNFENVEELTESFYKTYTQILLETSNKIITINMNTNISNEFSSFILSNIFKEAEDIEGYSDYKY